MWLLTGFSNPGRQWAHLQTAPRGKQLASQLMQICLSRAYERVTLSKYLLTPPVKMCKRPLFIRSTWDRPWVCMFLDSKKGVYMGFLPVTLHQALSVSPFSTKSRAISCFYLQPWWHHIPLGPPNPFWSISLVLMRLLLCEARRYYKTTSKLRIRFFSKATWGRLCSSLMKMHKSNSRGFTFLLVTVEMNPLCNCSSTEANLLWSGCSLSCGSEDQDHVMPVQKVMVVWHTVSRLTQKLYRLHCEKSKKKKKKNLNQGGNK